MIRLGLAITVAVVHALGLGFDHEPMLGLTPVGDVAVDAFFVLSGFLVTRSFLQLGSLRRYAWHRFLRIMPGFWVCLIVTAMVVAPLIAIMEGRPATLPFTAETDSSQSYMLSNAGLLMRQFGIAGLITGVPNDGVMDGALWTLFYEACCYVGVAALGVVGILRRSRGSVLLLCAVVWFTLALSAAGIHIIEQVFLPRFVLVFLLGAVAYLYAEIIPVSASLAVVSLAVVLASLFTMADYRVLGAPALVYLCVWAMVRLPLTQNPGADLSYGIYIYHWPILQILVLAGVAALTETPFVLLSLLAVALVAAASWFGVERPALSLKDAVGSRG